MQDNPTNDQENEEPSRRRFLKAAAGAGVVGAVWSEPLIRGIPAYAANASSIVGKEEGLGITWSTMRSNWEQNFDGSLSGSITRTSVGGDDFDSPNKCGVNAEWETVIAGEVVTITASGGPSDGTVGKDELTCSDLTSDQASISLEPQTGCTFSNVMVSAGVVNMTSGNPIVWSGAGGEGMVNFEFNIVCG